MATLDWSQCPAVENVPDRRSGAWVFRGTRMPVDLVFENLEAGSDHGTPSGIARALPSHAVTEAIERGWDRISNGDLLTLVETEGFDLFLTTDKEFATNKT